MLAWRKRLPYLPQHSQLSLHIDRGRSRHEIIQTPSTGAFYVPTMDVQRRKATAPGTGAWSDGKLAPKVNCTLAELEICRLSGRAV